MKKLWIKPHIIQIEVNVTQYENKTGLGGDAYSTSNPNLQGTITTYS